MESIESRSEVIQGHTFWLESKARVTLYIIIIIIIIIRIIIRQD